MPKSESFTTTDHCANKAAFQATETVAQSAARREAYHTAFAATLSRSHQPAKRGTEQTACCSSEWESFSSTDGVPSEWSPHLSAVSAAFCSAVDPAVVLARKQSVEATTRLSEHSTQSISVDAANAPASASSYGHTNGGTVQPSVLVSYRPSTTSSHGDPILGTFVGTDVAADRNSFGPTSNTAVFATKSGAVDATSICSIS